MERQSGDIEQIKKNTKGKYITKDEDQIFNPILIVKTFLSSFHLVQTIKF